MDGLTTLLICGIVGGLAGGLAVALIAILQKQKKCPECGEELPKTRKPKNRRQMLWGGWTCENCGCEIDRRGKKIEDEE
jgi:transposase-like protein